MKNKKLIGRKVKGFEFKVGDGLGYNFDMDKYVNKVGTIIGSDCNGNPGVQFPGAERKWYYPISQIEQHLVNEELSEQYEVGMTVYDYASGKGVIIDNKYGVDSQVFVQFPGESWIFESDGKRFSDDLLPSLSLTPYDLINGGATFPAFKPKLPDIEKGTLVYVKNSESEGWQIRFFSHFQDNGRIRCFYGQRKDGDTSVWFEYSLTNPLEKQ